MNDYRPQILFIHAYDGREPGIENYFDGVLANPMDKLEASTIPLTTVFDFLRDPGTDLDGLYVSIPFDSHFAAAKYNINNSLLGALNEIFDNNSLSNLMLNLIQYYPSSPLCNKEKVMEIHKQRKVQKTEQKHFEYLHNVCWL